MARKSRKQDDIETLRLENRMFRHNQRSEGIYSVIRSIIKYGFLAYVILNCRIGIQALAGQDTTSSFSLSLITDLKMNEWVAYLIGAGGTGYGWAQRSLRKSTVARVQGRNEKLEHQIDPKRSSSKLTKSGGTRKEDQ